MASHELYAKMEVHWNEFSDNHLKFTDKGNKAAATRARKAVGELKKLVTIKSWASCGVDPALMGTGPIPASKKFL